MNKLKRIIIVCIFTILLLCINSMNYRLFGYDGSNQINTNEIADNTISVTNINTNNIQNLNETINLDTNNTNDVGLFSTNSVNINQNSNDSNLNENDNNDISIGEINVGIKSVDNTPPEVTVSYTYNSETNTETVTVTSNEELKVKTLQGWVLSEDKKTYTAEYETNQTFYTNFTDLNGNKTTKQIVIDKIIQDGKPNITVEYTYNNIENTVLVTVTSDRKLIQKSLQGWILSADKKIYTAEYETNQNFYTNFTDIYGNKTTQQIVIDQINETDSPNITIEYTYNNIENTVLVTVTSDRKLIQKSLQGWILSADKKIYTAEYETNQNFYTNFTDIYGNKTTQQIVIDQINETDSPNITIEYTYNSDNNTVLVTATSDRRLVQKSLKGWILSENKKVYTAEYSANQSFYTNFTDIFGNKTKKEIRIALVDDKGPEISISYEYTYNDDYKKICIVTASSNEELRVKSLQGWILSEDKKTFTAEYTTSVSFWTNFTDKWGNKTTKNIEIAINGLVGIDVSNHNGNIDWERVKNAGIDFAIIRCGYGENDPDQDDLRFAQNIAECERLGIPYGIYLYSYALTENGAYSEAAHAIRLALGHEVPLGVWIDMEDADGYKQRHGMPTNETLVNICSIFCDVIESNSFKSGIYASLYWLNNQLNSSKLDKYDKWVAQWNDVCTYTKDYVMWQYTDSGQVDGISGNVDMNRLYV